MLKEDRSLLIDLISKEQSLEHYEAEKLARESAADEKQKECDRARQRVEEARAELRESRIAAILPAIDNPTTEDNS